MPSHISASKFTCFVCLYYIVAPCYVNNYCSPLGGFSARHSRDKILTILPHIGLEEAGQLVHDIALGLQQKALPGLQAIARSKVGTGQSLEILVTAGIAAASSSDDIEQIMEKAEANEKIIVKYQCSKEDSSQ